MTNSTGSAAHVAGLMPGDASNTLANEDLLPTTAAQRHWTWKDFAALWVGMVVCVPTYTMASSMLDQGFTWQMAVWLVFLANCIVLVPMVLIGRVGPRYGVPFPVLARASFGVKGANLPAVLRGLVACGWFSINCYFGALALHGFLNILGMTWLDRLMDRPSAPRSSCAFWRSGRCTSGSSGKAPSPSASSK